MTTFQITNEDTGRTFTFASEDAYEAAIEWYNTTEKGRIQEFCKANGVDINKTPWTLVDDWADVAMELYAKVG